MREWLPDEDVRKVMQEYIGYCLIPNTKFRKALFMYGKGKNGKSMLLEFLQEFFREHMSTLSYDNLFQRFGTANLKGKLVNIFDDTTVTFAKDTGIVKNLIAGGTVSAEFKGKDHFTFTNVARFIFSAQETPKTSDHSEAWYDRWIFIKFPNQFRPSNEKKIEIETALKEEVAGIFNWMLEGLRRLMENDGFTSSMGLLQTSQAYRNQNDVISMFISNLCMKVDECNSSSVHVLYKTYKEWSGLEGLRVMSKRNFIERIEDMGYTKKIGFADGKSGQTFFIGLSLDRNSEDFKEHALEFSIALQS
jgi:putative DNA primase/helicase